MTKIFLILLSVFVLRGVVHAADENQDRGSRAQCQLYDISIGAEKRIFWQQRASKLRLF